MRLAPNQSSMRSAVRSDLAVAARIISPNWPIAQFIAVNPLGGFEDMPFTEAVEQGRRWFGSRGTPTEASMRAAFAAGRISEFDAIAAIERAIPGARERPRLKLTGRELKPSELLLCDMLHGDSAPDPGRRAETVIDGLTAKWCAAYVDEHQARWQMPGRDGGFYSAWRRLAPLDRDLPRPAREALRLLPERADDALISALEALSVPESQRREYLMAHLSALPGWSAHMRWRADNRDDFELVDLLAIRISYEASLLHQPGTGNFEMPVRVKSGPAISSDDRAQRVADILEISATFEELATLARLLDELPVAQRPFVWLDAYESAYRDDLLTRVAAVRQPGPSMRADAQIVCCIDARSEGLRRLIEQRGNYETLGFAGFFAVAISYNALAAAQPDALCPVLLKPSNPISERAAPGLEDQARRHLEGRLRLTSADEAFHAAKDDMAAPFALAEASGWVAGPIAPTTPRSSRSWCRAE